MEITEFPQELQFEFFLDLPYEEIIKYCQANREALKVCQSELFWNLKLKRTEYLAEDWGYPKPSINIIRGPTPATKYRILEEILEVGEEASLVAIEEGQTELLMFFIENKPGLLKDWNKGMMPNYLSHAIYKAAAKKYYDTVETVWSILSNPEFKGTVFNNALHEALDDGDAHAALYLREFTEMTLFQMLDRVIEDYYDNDPPHNLKSLENLSALIDIIKSSGRNNFVQEFVLELFEDHGSEDDNIGDIVNFLNQRYPGEVDVRPLIREVLERYWNVSWMSRYI